jgi:Tol biopolymer transport system component
MPEDTSTGERIDSWKNIAAYLGRDARTVIRWEKEKGLPIRRISGGQRHCVFAYRRELDAWLAGQDHPNGVNLPLTNGNGSLAALAVPAPPVMVRISPASPLPHTAFRWKPAIYSAAGFLAALLLMATAYRFEDRQFSLHAPQITGQQQLTENGEEKQGLLTDGRNLYFGQEQNGWFALAKMPVGRGATNILWAPSANVLPVDLSPDGSHLLAFTYRGQEETEKEREMWIVPLAGGEPRRLTNIKVHSAAWAPDGKSIAFAVGNRIDLISVDGTALREIGSFGAIPDALHWSENGQHLRFLLQDTATQKLSCWEFISSDGMRTTTLRSMPSPMESYWAWTRAPGKDSSLVLGSGLYPGDISLWFIHYGKSWWEPQIQTSKIPLPQTGASDIAFDRKTHRLLVLAEPPFRNTFLRFDTRTQGFRQIFPGVSGTDLDYSRDGQWIVYATPRLDSIWISRTDGRDARQIVLPPSIIELPRWSPDGKQIAFMSKVPDRPWRIYITRLDTGATREASEGDDNQGAPTWSPDERFLVYGNVKCQLTHTCAIHRIDLSTGKVQTLPGSEGLFTARWSLDGRYVAALNIDQHQLFLFDIGTQKWHKLADAIDSADLSWSRDSKYLYTTIRGASPRIVRIRAADGHQETVLDLRAQDRFDLTEDDDLEFSLAPDDAVILHRQIHSNEVYAYDVRDQ